MLEKLKIAAIAAAVAPLPAALPLFLSAFGRLALIRVRRKTA